LQLNIGETKQNKTKQKQTNKQNHWPPKEIGQTEKNHMFTKQSNMTLKINNNQNFL